MLQPSPPPQASPASAAAARTPRSGTKRRAGAAAGAGAAARIRGFDYQPELTSQEMRQWREGDSDISAAAAHREEGPAAGGRRLSERLGPHLKVLLDADSSSGAPKVAF
mmetsp:Transcript_79331/g.220610  ORF Transcript_79331/g.220610 Transcript_79331/m.220610 type:complete len:109 (+) Transcript_79331:148-474(+)